ncbi:hypothetical protein GGF46_003498 [Coemansia sp. RSA 552]|nr:hypothetical protein GGF46_003498 [Coemansia sp. RSA 552]
MQLRPLHDAPYPIIDTDPIFSRVIKYMRASDVALMVGYVPMGPLFMWFMEKFHPTGMSKHNMKRCMVGSLPVSAMFGFMFAYKASSHRFFGFKENAREIKMYREEWRRMKAKGKPFHGVSSLPLSLQRTAAMYSTGAYFNLDVAPVFNFVNHPFHGRSKGIIPEEDE